MPCLSGHYDPAIGPLINLGVGQAGTIATVSASGQIAVGPPAVTPGASAPTFTSFPALMDTGASFTCISPAVVQTLRLQARGKRPMNSATHAVPMNVYLVDIVLPFGGTGLGMADMQVMEFAPPAGSPFQILVGRDILCRGVFTLNFDGSYTFSV